MKIRTLCIDTGIGLDNGPGGDPELKSDAIASIPADDSILFATCDSGWRCYWLNRGSRSAEWNAQHCSYLKVRALCIDTGIGLNDGSGGDSEFQSYGIASISADDGVLGAASKGGCGGWWQCNWLNGRSKTDARNAKDRSQLKIRALCVNTGIGLNDGSGGDSELQSNGITGIPANDSIFDAANSGWCGGWG